MGFWRGQFGGNPYIGLYAKASDRIVIIPNGSPEKFAFGAKVLDTPVLSASVDGSPYVGLYLAMNSNGIIAPPFLMEREKKELEATGLKVTTLPASRFCAIGNNIACNDHGALVNPDFPPALMHVVEKALGVPVRAAALAGYRTVGSSMVVTNKGWLAHNRIEPEEADMLKELFGCDGMNGTTNMGNALVGLGVVANSKGLIIGESCSGFEESRIRQALDLV